MRHLTVALLVALVGCAGGKETGQRSSGNAAVSDASADPGCWRQFEAQQLFTFRAPCSMIGGPVQGVDSYVGRYDDNGIVVEYDYGGYSSPLTEWSAYSGYQRTATVVDDLDAEIVTARDAADAQGFLAGLVIPRIDTEYVRLTLSARCDSEPRRELAMRIFRSVDLPR